LKALSIRAIAENDEVTRQEEILSQQAILIPTETTTTPWQDLRKRDRAELGNEMRIKDKSRVRHAKRMTGKLSDNRFSIDVTQTEE